jgi:hypothetical protein
MKAREGFLFLPSSWWGGSRPVAGAGHVRGSCRTGVLLGGRNGSDDVGGLPWSGKATFTGATVRGMPRAIRRVTELSYLSR